MTHFVVGQENLPGFWDSNGIWWSKVHLSGFLMGTFFFFFHQSLLSGNARGTTGTFRFYWQTAGAPYSRLQAENKADHRRSGEAGKEEWLQKKWLSRTATSTSFFTSLRLPQSFSVRVVIQSIDLHAAQPPYLFASQQHRVLQLAHSGHMALHNLSV